MSLARSRGSGLPMPVATWPKLSESGRRFSESGRRFSESGRRFLTYGVSKSEVILVQVENLHPR
jgi:hypothetical protein